MADENTTKDGGYLVYEYDDDGIPRAIKSGPLSFKRIFFRELAEAGREWLFQHEADKAEAARERREAPVTSRREHGL